MSVFSKQAQTNDQSPTETHAEIKTSPVAVADNPSDQPLSSLLSALSMTGQHLAIVQRRVSTVEPCARPDTLIVQPFEAALGRASKPHCRNGKIARLPKLERDMVNRLLFNNIPYAKIVSALDSLSINVTQRNISNWKTRGGYKEWCAEQERQLQLSLLQDHLTDYLRKNDAAQLPEVGLQVAATQLSSILLQPEAARELAADPKKYSQVVDMLCRLSTQISTLQKDRNEAVKQASIRGTSEHLKRQDEKEVEIVRSTYSSKIGKGPRDPDIPHRNDLPPRDELPFQEPPPEGPTMLEMLQYMQKNGRSTPGLPAPQPKLAEKPTAQTTAPLNGSANNGCPPSTGI